MNKSVGGQAKELAIHFYEKTGLKYTNKDIMVTVSNAKTLLKAGYTYDEIKNTIDYCVANPPSKGIYSFGFIINQINKVTTLLKNKQKEMAKVEAVDKSKFNDYGLSDLGNKNKVKLREEPKDINIFDK